jgi:hypothetical protein
MSWPIWKLFQPKLRLMLRQRVQSNWLPNSPEVALRCGEEAPAWKHLEEAFDQASRKRA